MNFIGDLDVNSPIKAESSKDLKIEFTKWTDGTSSERDKDFEPVFPPEIQDNLKVIVKYECEDGKKIFNQFQFKNGKKHNHKLKKLPKGFAKGKVYKPML